MFLQMFTFENSLDINYWTLNWKPKSNISTILESGASICCHFALNPIHGEHDTCCPEAGRLRAWLRVLFIFLPQDFLPPCVQEVGPTPTFCLEQSVAPQRANLWQRKGVHCTHSPISSCDIQGRDRAALLRLLTLVLPLVLVSGASRAWSLSRDVLSKSRPGQVWAPCANSFISLSIHNPRMPVDSVAQTCKLKGSTKRIPESFRKAMKHFGCVLKLHCHWFAIMGRVERKI